jgi:hypothetical protein
MVSIGQPRWSGARGKWPCSSQTQAGAQGTGGSRKERELKMDTLIVIATASFIASYALLVYRCLPQE